MNREKQILNYHLCEQLKDQNIKMAKLVDKLVNLSIHKSWEEDSFSSQKLLYQNALTELMSAQSSFNKVVGQVDWLLKGRRRHETDLFDRLEKSYNEDESSQIELLDAVKEILKFKKRKTEEEHERQYK